MPALLLQLQVNNLAGRQDPREQDDADCRVSNEAQDDAYNAPGWPTPSSAANHAEVCGALTPSADPSINPTGAAQKGRGGGSPMGGLKDEGGDREEEGESAVAMPTPSAEDRERLRTWGMDWGVVGVWSCPNSCDVSCEECVVVQLPV